MSVFKKMRPFAAFAARDILEPLTPGWDGTVPELLTFTPQSWAASGLAAQNGDLRMAYDRNGVFKSTARTRAASFSFGAWLEEKTNCYAYALGDRAMTMQRLCGNSNVGALAGVNLRFRFAPQDVLDAAARDGLMPTGDAVRIVRGFRPIALFYAIDRKGTRDFHWARLDNAGKDAGGRPRLVWSSKLPGETPRALPVADPRTAWFSIDDGPDVFGKEPRRGSDYYRFVSFVNVPDKLWVTGAAIERSREEICAHMPALARGWDTHLRQSGAWPAKAVPIPQHG